ncbi:MAG: CAP domain-containing protein, partial [Erysipelotrichaceae bacterium]
DGTSYHTALKQFGVVYQSAEENLTYAGTTVQDGFNWWMGSAGHRASLMNPSMTSIAIGYYNGMWCAMVMR